MYITEGGNWYLARIFDRPVFRMAAQLSDPPK